MSIPREADVNSTKSLLRRGRGRSIRRFYKALAALSPACALKKKAKRKRQSREAARKNEGESLSSGLDGDALGTGRDIARIDASETTLSGHDMADPITGPSSNPVSPRGVTPIRD